MGAPVAPPPPVYEGACPTIAAAPGITSLRSSGEDRELMIVQPATIAPGEQLPVVFIWHWLGGEASDVYEKLSLQNAVDEQRFIAVVPEAKGDILFRWPFGTSQPDLRMDEEMQFFDDMLACVAAALPIDNNCVSSIGVSAGALMTAQLASRRSERLASFASISGGVGGMARPWTPATRKLPALVLWGGPDDFYPENIPLEQFDDASLELETGLEADGHLIVECVHNCGHDLPPFEPLEAPSFDLIWRFVLDHPYWAPAGESIYQEQMPEAAPSWCAIGKGAATPRAVTEVCP